METKNYKSEKQLWNELKEENSQLKKQITSQQHTIERLREGLDTLIVHASHIGPLPSRNELTYFKEEIKRAKQLLNITEPIESQQDFWCGERSAGKEQCNTQCPSCADYKSAPNVIRILGQEALDYINSHKTISQTIKFTSKLEFDDELTKIHPNCKLVIPEYSPVLNQFDLRQLEGTAQIKKQGEDFIGEIEISKESFFSKFSPEEIKENFNFGIAALVDSSTKEFKLKSVGIIPKMYD